MRTGLLVCLLAAIAVSPVWSADKITGCLNSTQGVLYHVDEAPTPSLPCREGDREIQWNIQGTSGPPGPVGPPGAASRAFRFVGVTTTTFDGSGNGGGWLAMTRACAADFPGSRMAFSDEIRSTLNPPDIPAIAWIQPRFTIVDVRGFLFDATGNQFRSLSYDCGSWTSNLAGTGGGIVTPSGGIGLHGCFNVAPVACAAPEE